MTAKKAKRFDKCYPPTAVWTYIDESPGKGKGVFARADIEAGRLIEVCPLIVLSQTDAAICSETTLTSYMFKAVVGKGGVIAGGHGSFYNHSDTPNCEFKITKQNLYITVIKDIKEEEELTFNYGWSSDFTGDFK